MLPLPPRSTLFSLHDALPIFDDDVKVAFAAHCDHRTEVEFCASSNTDRKSTRLNSSHVEISYAVFCLKKKKQQNNDPSHLILGPTNPAAQTQTIVRTIARHVV